MAGIIRIISLNSLVKLVNLNSSICLIENITCRSFNNYSVQNVIQMFLNKKTDDNLEIDKWKQKLTKSLELERIPDISSRLAEEIRTSLLNLINSTKNDQDLDLIIKSLKKNSSILRSNLTKYLIGSNLMKLIYVLNKTDKSIELFNNEETQIFFLNRETILILMAKLAEERRFSEILFVFEHYLNYLKSVSTKKPILNDHLDVYTKSLYLIESEDTSLKVKNLFQHLDEYKFELSPTSIIYLFLSLIKQNDLDLVKDLFDKMSNYKLRLPDFLTRNLNSIYLARKNDIDRSLANIEHILNDKRLVFSLTLKFLDDSISKTSNKDLDMRFKQLKNRILKESRLARNSLSEYADNLAKPKVKSEQSKEHQTKAQAKNKSLNKIEISSEITSNLNESILIQMNSFFSEKKFNELVNVFENNLDTLNDFNSNDQCLKLVTASLYKINSKDSLNRAKRIVNKLDKNKMSVYFDDCSKLHVFLLALNQDDPYYAMGFLALTNVEKSSPTIYKNLRAAALAKVNKINDSINELKSITQITKNMFTNDGFIFQLAIDCLKEVVQKSNKHSNELNLLIEMLNTDYRVSNLNLTDLLCIKKNTFSKSLSQIEKKTNQSANYIQINQVDRINALYHECKFEQVVELFEQNLDINDLSKTNLEYVSKSCLKVDLDVQRLRTIIEKIKLNNLVLSSNSVIDYFLKLIQLNQPVCALEFLADFDNNNIFKNKSVYKNLLIIGFLAINKVNLAIEQLESLFQITLKQSLRYKYDGRIFPLTMNHIKWSLSSTNLEENQILQKMIDRCNIEKRLCSIDLDAVTKI